MVTRTAVDSSLWNFSVGTEQVGDRPSHHRLTLAGSQPWYALLPFKLSWWRRLWLSLSHDHISFPSPFIASKVPTAPHTKYKKLTELLTNDEVVLSVYSATVPADSPRMLSPAPPEVRIQIFEQFKMLQILQLVDRVNSHPDWEPQLETVWRTSQIHLESFFSAQRWRDFLEAREKKRKKDNTNKRQEKDTLRRAISSLTIDIASIDFLYERIYPMLCTGSWDVLRELVIMEGGLRSFVNQVGTRVIVRSPTD